MGDNLRGRLRFEAEGKTYDCRDELKRWGWHWDPDSKSWFLEAEKGALADDPEVTSIRDLEDVEITQLDIGTGVLTRLGTSADPRQARFDAELRNAPDHE